MDDRNAGLVRFLMRERHGTPFEHNFFRFHIKAPLFVTREWQRHRVGSFNERSGRYSELPDEFYVPAAGDVRTQVGKPGAYTFEPLADDAAESVREGIAASYAESYRRYQELLEARRREGGRAQRAAGRPLHRVLLVGQRALADELPLAAQRPRRRSSRSASTPRPPSGTSSTPCPSRTRRSSPRGGRRPERPPAARARGAGPRRRRPPGHAAAAVGARPRALLRGRRRRGLDADRLRPRHAGHRPALAGGARAARAPARPAHGDHALPPRPHRQRAPRLARDHRARRRSCRAASIAS